ncbi:MAG TPA: alcohol dehydrogenase catalytic domain-containing protein [Miltoncostaeaceae bacterium]|jgi:threonine dehydrogenase-like Zn-dependent dehydrogenase|nr:alcohol dehydrogenase catalytic domain-containing protein [Miltoncostaeaceae bacterium]
MRGLTFQGNGVVRVEEVPDPALLEGTDAIVRVTMAGICGSDLHVLHAGEAFQFHPGSRLGHEFLGTVEAVGAGVRTVGPGDRVLVAVGISCGTCVYCREGLRSACVRSSMFGWAPRLWRHGGDVQGGQSEFARVPLADATLIPIPESLAGREHEERLLPLIDVMSTGWHGLVTARTRAGDDVVVIGDGAVGLSAVHGARAMGAERIMCLGHHPDRLAMAERLGATHVSPSRDTEEIREWVRGITDGQGAHTVIDTVSNTASMEAAHAAARAGGSIACLGMDHFMGKTPQVNWYDQFVRNITVTGGLVPFGHYLPTLLELSERGAIDPSPMLTTRLPLADAADGYRLMSERAEGVVKVALRTDA